VVKEQHQLLVTLLLCNAAAMEALPIFLDSMFNEVVAVILSVTFVLAFGEVRSYKFSHSAPKFTAVCCLIGSPYLSLHVTARPISSPQ
jgi:hypothetical protein